MADTQATDVAPPTLADPGLDAAQVDGAQPTSMLHEPEYDVQVELSELQKDTAHPLGSATTFDQLGLYVYHPSFVKSMDHVTHLPTFLFPGQTKSSVA